MFEFKYDAKQKNIYDMLDIPYTATREKVRSSYLDFIKNNDLSIEDVRIIGDEFKKFFSMKKEDYDKQMESIYGREYDDQINESIKMVNDHYLSTAIDDFSKKNSEEEKQREFEEKVENSPIKYDENGNVDLSDFSYDNKTGSYSDGGKFALTNKSVKGKSKNNLKQILVTAKQKIKKNTKKGIIIVLSAALITTAMYSLGNVAKENILEKEKHNNIVALYTVKQGDTLKKLEEEFYKLDIVERPLQGFNLAEFKTQYGDNALLEGDKLFVLTNEETYESKEDNIKLLNTNEIEMYLSEDKLLQTKEAAIDVINGDGQVDYVTANSKTY